jgi:ubiquinone biosynthesis monooxygenase Coq7
MKPISPNTPSQKDTLDAMIRVNHAGEYGAVRIYQGQLDALKGTASENTIRHMQDQERVHLAAFDHMIQDRHVRPTALSPLWHVAGYALGYLTGRLGEKAAMACTVAVETAIDAHYLAQEKILSTIPQEQDLYETIQKFRQEEADHKATALQEGAEQTPGYSLLSTAIQGASRLAIFLSKRI